MSGFLIPAVENMGYRFAFETENAVTLNLALRGMTSTTSMTSMTFLYA